MATDHRRAKVTPEHQEEARKLVALWEARNAALAAEAKPLLTQSQFGEAYEIGNQSAVGQFLRGAAPLSMKAARGFATGLNCRIEDFSPRLAAKAAEFSMFAELSPEVASIAREINALTSRRREYVLRVVRETLRLASNNVTASDEPEQRHKQG